MITKQFEETYNYDKAMRLKDELNREAKREYWRKRILEIEEAHLDIERPLLKWEVPEWQKPKKNKKSLLVRMFNF